MEGRVCKIGKRGLLKGEDRSMIQDIGVEGGEASYREDMRRQREVL